MKTPLRIAALVLAVASLAAWLGLGRNTGWTKTSVTTMQVDPVTTLEFPVTERRFVPGVDALGAALAVSAALFAGSLFVRSKTNTPS